MVELAVSPQLIVGLYCRWWWMWWACVTDGTHMSFLFCSEIEYYCEGRKVLLRHTKWFMWSSSSVSFDTGCRSMTNTHRSQPAVYSEEFLGISMLIQLRSDILILRQHRALSPFHQDHTLAGTFLFLFATVPVGLSSIEAELLVGRFMKAWRLVGSSQSGSWEL